MRRVSIIIFLFVSLYTAYAVGSYPYPIQVTQPDGTVLTILIKGDEHFHYTTTTGGRIIAQGKDKFYYYASYESGKLLISQTRVSPYTPCPMGVSAFSVPAESMIKIRQASISRFSSSAAVKSAKSAVKAVRTIVIPVQFQDVSFAIQPAKQHFDNMINQEGYSENGATGSAKDYFKDNLSDSIDIRFDVAEVVTLSKPLAFYGANAETDSVVTQYDVNIKQFVIDACNAVDKSVDFSLYTSVFIFYAGYSEAEGGGSDAIWPLSWNLSSPLLTLDGVKIYTFSCASELRGADGDFPSGIGTFCHEFGHVLGLEDLYDTDYEEGGQSKGLWGTLSLMDFGCYNNQGRTPPYFCAIDRELIGCSPALSLEKDKSYTLQPINRKYEYYKVPSSVKDEYFLIEVREEAGWDAYIGGSGMLIYHIDKSSNIAGAITASLRWTTNTINTFSGHECADLVESMPSAVNIRQVFFPGIGNITSFTSLTTPPFAGWNLKNVGIKLTQIKNTSAGVSFSVSEDSDERLLKVLKPDITAYQQEALIAWDTDLDISAKWGVRWGEKSVPDSMYNERIVSKRECVMDGLEGEKEYSCEVFYIGNNSNGDTLSTHFKTVKVNSPYPYIYGIKNEYSVGDTLKLKLFNVLELTNSIEWYADGQKIDSQNYIFISEGKKKISVRITYSSDKTVEIIEKEVNVNMANEDE